MKIQKLSQNRTENKSNRYGDKRPEFKGVLDVAAAGLQLCNQYPMIGVAVKDTAATNVPRTVMDFKDYGFASARETAWREFSGLFVNCLIPSFFVLGAGKLIDKHMMKDFKGVSMAGGWANQDTLEKFASIYKNVKAQKPQAKAKSFIVRTLANLEGAKDNGWINFKDVIKQPKGKDAVRILTEAITTPNMGRHATKKAVKEAYKMLSELSGATETLRFKDEAGKVFTSNLSEILRDQVDLGRKFANKHVSENLDGFVKKASKMVNYKSLMGLAIVVPLAMSMQYINRAITRKQYAKDGPPVYKDFEKRETHKLSSKEKKELNIQKAVSIAGMLGLSLLSIMKKPNLKMFQFKGWFPTVDQCRGVATSTFVSRLLASENLKELGMNRRRDMGSFAFLYFLGDYVSKGTATLIEKVNPKVKLLNKLSDVDANASVFKKFGNWVKNTKLKSFDEVKGNRLATNMRSLCELSDIGFSIGGLGFALTKYNNWKAEKFDKEQEKKAKEQGFTLEMPTYTKSGSHTQFSGKFANWQEFEKNEAFADVATECFK